MKAGGEARTGGGEGGRGGRGSSRAVWQWEFFVTLGRSGSVGRVGS